MQTSVCLTAVLLTMLVLAESQSRFKPGNYRRVHSVGQIELHNQIGAEPTRPPRQSAVLVKCYEESLEVVVQADLYDIGVPVDGRDLHLGVGSVAVKGTGGPCDAVQSGPAEFTIHAGLTECGTQLSSTENKLVYSNLLVYSPEPSPEGLLRLDGTAIQINCHYQKRYGVDSDALRPTWVPFTSTAFVEDQLDFTLLLVTDDGLLERGSNVYFLGERIHLEAAIVMGNHVPLRVFVDYCVATATPDVASSPRYDFMENHGCLVDAQLTSSGSHFLPRSQDDKLHFVLDAFRFHQVAGDSVYISCLLKALPAQLPVSSRNRACSFTDNRWRSADDNDAACGSCDVSKRLVDATGLPRVQSHQPTRISATTSQPKTKHNPANFIRARPGQSTRTQRVWKRGTDSMREWSMTAHLGPLTVLPEDVIQPSVHVGVGPLVVLPQEVADTFTAGISTGVAGPPGLGDETGSVVNATEVPSAGISLE